MTATTPLPHPPDARRWVPLSDDALTVWVNLDHVRQILFTEEGGEPRGLLWSGGDLYEIADPAALRAVRAWVQGHALPVG